MIRNRLAELLFERDIKIVRMARDINISRNTITNTASNNSEMIQIKTINKICKYLDITPCEFFEYLPLDVEFSFDKDKQIYLEEVANGSHVVPHFNCDLLIDFIYDKEIDKKTFDAKIKTSSTNVISKLPGDHIFSENEVLNINIEFYSQSEQENFEKIYNDIPNPFKKMIYNDLVNSYKKFLLNIIPDTKSEAFEFLTDYEVINMVKIEIDNEIFKYY